MKSDVSRVGGEGKSGGLLESNGSGESKDGEEEEEEEENDVDFGFGFGFEGAWFDSEMVWLWRGDKFLGDGDVNEINSWEMVGFADLKELKGWDDEHWNNVSFVVGSEDEVNG